MDGRRRRLRTVLISLTVSTLVAGACSYETRSVAPELPQERQSSRIYAADGTEITTFFFEQNRTNVDLPLIPEQFQQAVIAIEDERFYEHRGVDLRAVLRAVRTNTESGGVAEGGSTITQQYVKNALIDNDEQTLARKVEEASIAFQLERQYTKHRILELYLNTIYFGNEAYGVGAASFEYFGKPVTELSLPESALLAGLINSPVRYDPYQEPEAAVQRRDIVLDRMLGNGYITEEEATQAKQTPLELTEATPPEQVAYPAAYFVEEVKQWILRDPRFGDSPQARRDLLFGGGIRIHTTVDLDTQFLAEVAVAEVLPDPSAAPDAALVAIEPNTGFVRAMVGGRDFFGPEGEEGQKLNLATQAFRQPGSAFKPIVLATAIEDGIPVTQEYPAPGRIVLERGDQKSDWTVSNYGGGSPAPVTLFEATIRSYNTVYAQLMLDVGAEHAIDRAKEYGIRAPIQPNDAAVLGSELVTALDMASTFGTFANRGVHVPPALVTRIINPDGTILYEHEHAQQKVLETTTADQLTEVLRQNIERGTGTRAKIGQPAAGKTGTTSDWRDAWFVGYTPGLATAVWVGFQERGRFMQPPKTPIRVTGGSYPAQIWGAFMSKAVAGSPVEPFPTPPTSTTTTGPAPPGGSPLAASPPGPVLVPALVGLAYGDAAAALTDLGLVPRRVEVADQDQPPGAVVSQSPPAETQAAAGSAVTVEVATG